MKQLFQLAAIILLLETALVLPCVFGLGISDSENSLLLNAEIPVSELEFEDTADNLTKQEQIGQMFFIAIPGTTLDEETKNLLDTVKPGGILLFAENIETKPQTQKLTADLQRWASEAGLPPLFIAVDEEGGIVERIAFDQVEYSAAELGKFNDEQTTRHTARETAETLKDLGINVNFAPVADIAFSENSIMTERAFGNDPDDVSRQIGWTIEEYNDTGIIACAKHFPGHGRTTTDSHEALPTIGITKDQWRTTDGKPFKEAILSDVPMIMVGHLKYPQIDSNIASQSKVWMTDILRDELGLEGLIVTDDLKMGGAQIDGNYTEKIEQSVTNGADMIILALEPDETGEVVRQVVNSEELTLLTQNSSKITEHKKSLF